MNFTFRFKPFLLACFSFYFVVAITGCGKDTPKSRIEKRASLHLNAMEKSAIALEHGMEKVADAHVLNTPKRMRETVKFIKAAQTNLDRANQDVKNYIAFINANRGTLKPEKLDAYIVIKKILDRPLTAKRQAISAYCGRMIRWLEYSANNFKQLKAKHQRARHSYDALLIDVHRSQKQYNLANEEYRRHVDEFLKTYPALTKKFKRQYQTMKKELGWL